MKFSLAWLRQFIDIDLPLDKLIERVTMSAFEIESVEEKGEGLDRIVIGKVVKLEAHPNADKLRVATVKLGNFQKCQIVCGAPNIAEGQLVPVILPGSLLPGEGGFLIEERELRGVLSQGMICSEKELGLSASHEGIMVLPETARIGDTLAQFLGYRDTVLDIKVTANRTDAFSHVGMARELGAVLRKSVSVPSVELADLATATLDGVPLKISVEAGKLAPVYEALVVSQVQVLESPQWMRNRLAACGMRSINNIVDATNIVLLELGQPMHAFDYAHIAQSEIVVREARAGEQLATLDGATRTLAPRMLVIADPKTPLAIAGVIGGAASGVSEHTKTLVIEAATFDRVSVRKTSRALGVRTQASGQFERGVNPALPRQGLARFLSLLKETCPELRYGNLQTHGTPAPRPAAIELDIERATRMLGLAISKQHISEILVALGCDVHTDESERKAHLLQVTPPWYRADLTMDQDLMEEIGRLHGYDRVTPALPHLALALPAENRLDLLEDDVRDELVALGFSEIATKSFVGDWQRAALGEAFDADAHIEILNPMNPEQRFMRTSLMETLLPAIELNAKHAEHFKLFEVGRAFDFPPAGERHATPARETHQLAAAVVHPHDDVYYRLKRALDVVMHVARVPAEKIQYKKISSPLLHPGKSAAILLDNVQIGLIGEIHPALQAKLGVHGRVACAQLNTEPLISFGQREIIYKQISKYPSSLQDLSVIVDATVPSREVLDTIKEFGKKLIGEAELVEVYQDDKLGKDKKSLLYRIRYQSSDHTLTDDEVKRMHERIMDAVKDRHQAHIRM